MTIAPVSAHEVIPSIADFSVAEGQVVFTLRANLESFIAGVDLAGVADIDQSAQAADYDALRALDPAALAAAFRRFWPQMAAQITLMGDDQPLQPVLTEVSVPEVGNVALLRTSQVSFHADLPPDAQSLTFQWAPGLGAIVLRQMDVAAPYDGYLDRGARSAPIALTGGDAAHGWQTFLRYIPVGFDHILPKGLDHILFVLGLFFLAAGLRSLVLQISLFTLAHTITLALAALGYLRLPAEVVEPLIAASIIYVAVENIFTKRISPWRPVVIFGFGLLHGLGFAAVLEAFGLPQASFIPALIGFNIGVELGQLAVIGLMALLVWQAVRVDRGANDITESYVIYGVLAAVAGVLALLDPAPLALLLQNPVWVFALPLAGVCGLCALSVALRDRIDGYRIFVAVPASAAIAAVGAFWVIERVAL